MGECPPEQQEPGTPWDIALLVAAVAAAVPFVVANAVITMRMRWRKYVIAQGGVALILTSSACGLVWISSSFVTNLHFPRSHPFLRICFLWSFWLQLTFGFWLWLVSIIVRFYRLYYLVKDPSGFLNWKLFFLLLWVPAVAFAIVATGFHASRIEHGDSACTNCYLTTGWKWATFFSLPIIYFVVVVFLLIQSKDQEDYMLVMEFSHMSEYTLMAFVIFLLYGVTMVTQSEMRISGRSFLTFCICCLVFSHFWVRMGWPVYLCLFKGDTELDSFEEELRCCGAECFDKIRNASGIFTAGRTSFSLRDSDWILRATNAALNEASECKQRISELEDHKIAYTSRIKELQMLTGRSSPSRLQA